MRKYQELEELFTPYVDGEVASEQRAFIAGHLEHCPPCRDRVGAERAAREAIVAARAELRGCASGELRARCAAHCAGAAAGRVPIFRRAASSWLPLSLAATLVLALAGAFILGLNNTVEALAAQLTLDHMKCFEFPPDRTTPDAVEAGRAWTNAQGWTLQVPAALSEQQLELVCVRRCLSTDGRMAHIMYKWRGRPLSVYVMPNGTGSNRQVQASMKKFGHEAVMWSGADRTYAVLGRGRPIDLAPVVEYVKAHAR